MMNKKEKILKILVINGPNLNMLGVREPEIYGSMTLDDIQEELKNCAKSLDQSIELEFFQSNFEGEIVDKIQNALNNFDGIIINPAAYTHTSVAIADAIASVNIKTVEVHLSNILAREEFRRVSYTGAVSAGVISGFGAFGYHLALISILHIIGEVEAIKEAQTKQMQANNA